MHKNLEINWTKIKGGCQSGRKVVTHNSKSYLPLIIDNSYESIFSKSYMYVCSVVAHAKDKDNK